jgi:hypothetical protein
VCHPEDGSWSVPKRELAGVLQVLLGTRRLQVAPALPLALVLGKELATFTAKINVATGSESFEAWRTRDHDDLVLAVALACWYAERARRELWVRLLGEPGGASGGPGGRWVAGRYEPGEVAVEESAAMGKVYTIPAGPTRRPMPPADAPGWGR